MKRERRTRTRLLAGCSALLLFIGMQVAAAPATAGAASCTATWLGGFGSWDTAAKWSPASVPDASDDVCINAAASSTVVLNHTAQVNSLFVGGSAPAQNLRVGHSNGINTTFTVSSSAEVTATGTVVLTSGDGSTANTRINVDGSGLTNAGKVSVDKFANGTFVLAGSVLNTGTFTVEKSLTYHGGTFTNDGPITVGPGLLPPDFVMTGGTFNLGTGSTTGRPLILRGGALNFLGAGPAAFIVEGHVRLTGNMVAAQRLTVRVPATGDASLILDSDVTAGGTLVLESTAGATGDAAVHTNGHTLTNSGTLEVIGPSGTRRFDGDLVNTGTLNVAYDLAYPNGGSLSNTGLVDLASGSVLAMTGGSTYHQEATGTLHVGIGGPSSAARIEADGAVTLGGTLKVSTTFSPAVGQSFDVITVCCGAAVTGTFSSVEFNVRTYQVLYGSDKVTLIANAAAGGSGGFTNPTPITMRVTSPAVSRAGPGNPYPSTIEVAGLDGGISDVNVTLCGFSAGFPSDADFLLVSPLGTQALILSDVGGTGNDVGPGADVAVSDLTLTLDDQAATPPNGGPPLVSGTFQPLDDDNEQDDYGTFGTPNTDYFPPPAPPLGSNVALSIFNGEVPNGLWSLYLVDDYPSTEEGVYSNLSCGWSLEVATASSTAPTDIAVYRPSTSTWYIEGGASTTWGTDGDIPVPGDYDGDGDTDVAVYRPSAGTWFVEGGPTVNWGTDGDVPVPGDYDGDGDTDVAVYRTSSGVWYIQGGATVAWGTAGDIPVPADYDANGTTDVAVFRPSAGTWFVQGGATANWGTAGDIPVPADYDGDGDADVAVFRPSAGTWFVQGGVTVSWGTDGDVPVPGDYDGDGTTDVAVFRPSSGLWFVQGGPTVSWGAADDVPLPLPHAIYDAFF